MSGIRLADIPDIDAICKLGEELLADSVYKDIKPDPQKFRMFLAGMMGNNKGIVLVVTDDHDRPQGFLIGMIEELFFSKRRMATDLAVYIRKEYRNLGGSLIKRFINWAESKPRVVQIMLGISSGSGDFDRVGAMYESFGLSRVGGIYVKRI